MSIGAGELVLDRAVEYAKVRRVFGRTIGANQAIQFPLAQIRAELEGALLLTQKAAWALDQGRDGAFLANAAALLGGQAGFRAADRALQTLGGMGFARENDVERYFRDLRLFRSAPVPEEMALSYIAQHVLGLPRSF
jgi:acyl-CoA dehydrogenase